MKRLTNVLSHCLKLRPLPLLLFALLLAWSPLRATDYYVDPASGSMGNSGSSGSPWSTLEDVFDAGKTFSAGDVIHLRNGHHGFPAISGDNAGVVTIQAQSGHTPELRKLSVNNASNWLISGLTISPETVSSYEGGTIVQIGLNTNDITLHDCFIYSALDTSSWSISDWTSRDAGGISVAGQDNVITENHLLNVQHGISVGEASGARPSTRDIVVSYNVIENFSGDGIRGLADYCTYEYNIIMNCYNVDGNHDDGFQSWTGGYGGNPVGSMVQYGVVLRGNMIFNQTDPNQPHTGPLQGMGNFDGFFEDWVIENNLIVVNHWHGITLMGATNCKIVNNTVMPGPFGTSEGPPWIRIVAHKDGTPSTGNLIRNNLTSDLSNDSGIGTVDFNIETSSYTSHFVDYANFDFHLKSSSTAVDAGTTSQAPAIDIEENQRVSPYDVGAYEFDASPPAGDTQEPSAPQNLTAVSVTSSSVDLSWSASTDNVGVTGYNVYINGANPVGVSATSTTIGGLAPSTQYSFTVSAVDAAQNESAQSSPELATTSSGGGSGNTLVDEDFALGSAANAFTVVAGGTWSVSSGRYVLSSPASAGNGLLGNISVYNTVINGDYTVSAVVNITGDSQLWNDAALIFDYQDSSNFCYVSLNESNDGFTRGVFKIVNGTPTELADISMFFTSDTDYLVSVERAGSSILVRVDGVQVASVNDSTFSGGQVGFGSKNDSSQFDDLLVTVPSAGAGPAISAHPQSEVVEFGANAQFGVTASGDPAPDYQWRKDGGNLSGETSDTLVIASADFADAGSYDVVVSNSEGSVTSNAATLTVEDTTAPSVPQNLAASNIAASSVDLSWDAASDAVGVDGYLVYTDGANPVAVSSTSTTINGLSSQTQYSFTVSAVDAASNESAQSTAAQATTTGGQQGETILYSEPFNNESDPLVDILASGMRTTFGWTAHTAGGALATDPQVVVAGSAGGPAADGPGYIVYAHGGGVDLPGIVWTDAYAFDPSAQTNLRFSLYAANSNVAHALRVAIRIGSTWYVSETAFTTASGSFGQLSGGEFEELSYSTAGSDWRELTFDGGFNASGTSLSLSGSTVSGSLPSGNINAFGVYLSSSGSGGNLRFDTFTITAGSGQAGDTEAPSTPQNLSASNETQNSVDLSWSASTDNVGVDGYKVYTGGANPKAVSGTSTTMSGLMPNTSYTFTVTAVDEAENESAPSSGEQATTLPELAAPTIQTHPQSQTVEYGANAQLGVSASGNPAPDYQWRKDGSNLAGETSGTLLIANADFSDAGSYDVVVSNSEGSVTSNAATLTVEDTTAPSVPQNLTASNVTASSVDLSWDPASDAVGVDGYKVYIDGANPVAVSGTSTTINGLTAETQYSFTVTSVDAASNESAQSTAEQVVTSAVPLGDTVLYSEPFNNGSDPLTDILASGMRTTYAWTAHTAGGALASDPQVVIAGSAGGPAADGPGYIVYAHGGGVDLPGIVWTDAYAFDPSAQTNLRFSLYAANSNVAHELRIAIRIGSTWYVSETAFTTASGSFGQLSGGEYEELGYSTAGGDWRELTFDGGFNAAGTSLSLAGSTVSGSLPTGNINAFGVYLSSSGSGGNLRFDTFTITASSAPAGDTQAPSVPQNLAAQTITDTWVDLVWDPSTDNVGVDGYKVYTDGANPKAVATTSTTMSNLTPDTNYAFTVSAVDAAQNESAQSSALNVTTDPAPQPDPEPEIIAVSASADDGNVPSNTLDSNLGTRWSAQGNGQWISWELNDAFMISGVRIAFHHGDQRIAFFDIEVSLDGQNWTPVFSGQSSGTSTALETFLFTEVEGLYVRYVGYGNSTNAWNSLTEAEILIDMEAPTAPTNLSATAVSESQIDLSWTAGTDDIGVAGYDIYRNGQYVDSTAALTYQDTGLSADTLYTYVLYAVDYGARPSSPSSAAQATTFAPDTQAPSAPGSLAASAVSNSQINLSWNASTDNVGVVGYDIYRDSQYLKTVSSTSTSDSGLQANSTYSYQVVALDAAENESSPSNTAQATTQSDPSLPTTTQLSQYGITWTFQNPVSYGQYVTGDYWVVGPATVVAISPSPTSTRHGSAVNPMGNRQAYDSRTGNFDTADRPSLPFVLQAGQSLVSSVSKPEGATIKNVGCLVSQAVLTAVSAAPAADAFRPGYAGTYKASLRASDIDWLMLPDLPAPASAPNGATVLDSIDRPRIDHIGNWTIQHGCAEENWQGISHPCYGRDYSSTVSRAAMYAMLDTPDRDDVTLYLIQMGIDNYSVLRAGGGWNADGGHHSARLWPIVFGAVLLDDTDMLLVGLEYGDRFGENDQTYYGVNGTPLFGKPCSNAQYFLNGCSGSGSKDCRDPAGLVDGCADYRNCCTSHTWVGQMLAVLMLDGARTVWDHEAYFDYVDRWMSGGVSGGGYAGSTFIADMWNTYRASLP